MTARHRLPDRRRRNRFCCIDCGINTDTIGEYYMLRAEVWNAAVPGSHDGMLCIGCVEARLHRRLEPADFESAPTNLGFAQSPRLMSRRLWGEERRNAQQFIDRLIDDVIIVLRRDRLAGLSILDLELLLDDVRVGAREKLSQLIRNLGNRASGYAAILEVIEALGGDEP